MPSTNLREVDKTNVFSPSDDKFVVLIPGLAKDGYVEQIFEPYSYEEFEDKVGGDTSGWGVTSLTSTIDGFREGDIVVNQLGSNKEVGNYSYIYGVINEEIVDGKILPKITGWFEGTTTSDVTRDNYVVGMFRIEPTLVIVENDKITYSVVNNASTVVGDSVAYNMAYQLLKRGMSVLYVPVNEVSDVEDEEFYEKYEDKRTYNIGFVTTGGFTSKLAIENAIKCSAERGDCVAIVDVPSAYETSTESIQTFIETLDLDAVVTRKAIENWDDETGPNYEEVVSKYGSIFAPHFTSSEIKESDNNTKITLPSSFAYLLAFAKSRKNYAEWFATAGEQRGIIPLKDVELNVKYTDADIQILLARNTKDVSACNLIVYDRVVKSNIVYGNRTLYKEQELVASSFLNIRVLSDMIKKVMYNAGEKFRYEPNSEVLWNNFTSYVEKEILNDVKSGQGVRGFKWTKYVSKKRALVRAKLQIVPIEPVEDFDLTLELTDEVNVNE